MPPKKRKATEPIETAYEAPRTRNRAKRAKAAARSAEEGEDVAGRGGVAEGSMTARDPGLDHGRAPEKSDSRKAAPKKAGFEKASPKKTAPRKSTRGKAIDVEHVAPEDESNAPAPEGIGDVNGIAVSEDEPEPLSTTPAIPQTTATTVPAEIEALWRVFLKSSSDKSDKGEYLAHLQWRKDMRAFVAGGGQPFGPETHPLPPGAPPKPTEVIRPGCQAVTLGFDPTHALTGEYYNGHWNFHSSLGEGGFGHAGLWIKFDRSGNIIARVAVKETYVGEGHWQENHLFWDGDIADRKPNEAAMQQRIQEYEDALNVVKCYGYAVHESLTMIRVYLEYCPCGDLENVIKQYVEIRDKKPIDADGEELNHHIPTHLLWCIFEALASVANLMAFGHIPGMKKPELKRATDYHFDIKPRNVFLSNPGSHNLPTWPGLPVPRLGDWGAAMREDQPQFATHSREIGSVGYKPPERYSKYAKYNTRKIGPHSDLWSIGRTMASLMNLDRDGGEHDDIVRDPPEGATTVQITDEAQDYYPDRMVQLVQQCLAVDWQKRPRPVELWNTIQKEITVFRGLSSMPLKMTAVPPAEVLRWKLDIYHKFVRPAR